MNPLLRKTKERLMWQDRAKCGGNDDFIKAGVREQVEFCKGCPVTAQCLVFALECDVLSRPPADEKMHTGWPVYGGLTVGQRLEILRSKRRKPLR